MTQKTILFLGAAEFQTPPIHHALSAGYRVVTSDNRPDNPGHALAHRSYNVSTLDIDAIRRIAESEAIDGILSFGSDVSAYTVATVARMLGLPGNSPESIETLSRKHLFRQRLRDAGIQAVRSCAFGKDELDLAIAFGRSFGADVIVKPTDASGSKGVSICAPDGDLFAAVDAAFAASRDSLIVLEEFVPRLGYQICGDGWFQDGKIDFVQYGNGHFHDRADRMAPYGETFPSAQPAELLDAVTIHLEQALQACSFESGPFNLDVRIDQRDRRPFIVEIGPRSGGNYLPTAIRYQSGVDMIEAAVENALSAQYRLRANPRQADGFVCCFMLHASEPGTFNGFSLGPDIGAQLLEYHPYVRPGGRYLPFSSADRAIGNLILKFGDYDRMLQAMNDPDRLATLA